MKRSFEDWWAQEFTAKGGKDNLVADWGKSLCRQAWDAALAQQEPPCNNPLRSEITCADLVRDNDNLREELAQAKALYLEELHTRALAQQAQPGDVMVPCIGVSGSHVKSKPCSICKYPGPRQAQPNCSVCVSGSLDDCDSRPGGVVCPHKARCED